MHCLLVCAAMVVSVWLVVAGVRSLFVLCLEGRMAGAKLATDSVLRGRWNVLRKLAEGGFGAVYEALDMKTNNKVAIKIESTRQANPVLKVDLAILLKLRGKTQHACGIFGSGVEHGQFNFIVMSLVGPSLDDLLKSRPNQSFGESTNLRLGRQCLKGIEDLHAIGFVHRDVKPGNFAIGRRNSDRRIVYLLDFGLARYYQTKNEEGKMETRPPRNSCGFRGTVRYASPNAHDGLELGRHDDIWSLLYVLIEFHHGRLPWHKLGRDADVAQMKRDIDMTELIGDMGDEFEELFGRLREMRFREKPDYNWFQSKFKAIQEGKSLPIKGAFEWEEEKKEE